MNFAQVRQAVGKLDEKNYPIKIAMFGTPTLIDVVKFSSDRGTRTQQVTMTDDSGESQKVKIYLGKDKTMGDGCIGRRLAFNISPNPYQKDPSQPPIMYYGGFWNDRATVAPARSGGNAPQPPQGASNIPIPPKGTSLRADVSMGLNHAPQPDWDAKDLRMAKECALKCAVSKQVVMADISKDLNKVTTLKIIETAEEMLKWIYDKQETPLEKEAGDLLREPTDFDQLEAEAREEEGR